MTATTRVGAPAPAASPAPLAGSRYIPEIQGLRTLASLLVAAYHIWFARVSGGVDVFFVVAAYFMMASFCRRGQISGGDLLRYWSATARRVCPVMVLVICVTLAALYAFEMMYHWRSAIFDAALSLVFAENWWLAWTGADYLDRENPPSLFQQMWALSLQMQVAAALPVLLWLAGRYGGSDPRRAWTVLLTAIGLASFTYSVAMTRIDQPWAYFDSLARLWEFAAGALLALWIDRLPRLPGRLLTALGYGALLVVSTFAAFLPVGGLFPGVAALIPVSMAVLLIYVARNGIPIAPLRWGPVLAMGNISFAFYLWHWPVLLVWRELSGSPEVSLPAGFCIILVAGLLAAISVHLIETPFRRHKRFSEMPGLGLFAGLATALPAVAGIAAFAAVYKSHKAEADADFRLFQRNPAAFAADADNTIVPHPILVGTLWRTEYGKDCHQVVDRKKVLECVWGDPEGTRTIVLHGGSHSIQWLPALLAVSGELDLRIVQISKVGCPTYDGTTGNVEIEDLATRHPSCRKWNDASRDRILELDPDLVMTIATLGSGPEETIPESFKAAWREITEAGIPMLVLRDNPRFFSHVAACVARNIDDPDQCNEPRDEMLGRRNPGASLDMERVTYLDLADLFCDAEECWTVRDGTLIYRDAHHITGTYAAQAADRIGPAVARILKKTP